MKVVKKLYEKLFFFINYYIYIFLKIFFKGTGNWDKCVLDLANVLFNHSNCPINKKCFFGGVIAPPISLSNIELYGFSEYWFSVDDVFSLGGDYYHDIFERKAKNFCKQNWRTIKVFN